MGEGIKPYALVINSDLGDHNDIKRCLKGEYKVNIKHQWGNLLNLHDPKKIQEALFNLLHDEKLEVVVMNSGDMISTKLIAQINEYTNNKSLKLIAMTHSTHAIIKENLEKAQPNAILVQRKDLPSILEIIHNKQQTSQ